MDACGKKKKIGNPMSDKAKNNKANRKKIADKIAKCLALATSENPTEAATANRQAIALMSQYNLTSRDVAAAL
jgi:hypothetical protein